MMRRLLIIVGLLVSCASLYATNVADTLFLKNGSVILCTVEDYAPAGDIKVKTGDGSLFVYPSSEILRLAKTKTPATPAASYVPAKGKLKAQGINLYQNGKRLTVNDDIPGILGEELSKKYEWSRGLYMGGWMCLAAGLGFTTASIVCMSKQKDYAEGTTKYDELQFKKTGFFWAGIGFDAATVALVFISQGMTKKIAEEYNLSHPDLALSITPSLIPTANPNSAVGLAPGITIAYSF